MRWRSPIIVFTATAAAVIVSSAITWIVSASNKELSPITIHYVITASGPIAGPQGCNPD